MPSKRAAKKEKLESAFKAFDADSSGTLDAAELRKILLRTGGEDCKGMTEEDAEELIEEFDKNGDGELSLDEFVTCMLDMEGDDDDDDDEEEVEEKEDKQEKEEKEEEPEEPEEKTVEAAAVELTESGPFGDEDGWVLCGTGADGVYSNAPFGYEEEEGVITAEGLSVKCREAASNEATDLEAAVAAYKAANAGVAVASMVRLTGIGGKYPGWYFTSADKSDGGFLTSSKYDFVGYVEVSFNQYGDDVTKKLVIEASGVEDTSGAIKYIKQVHTP